MATPDTVTFGPFRLDLRAEQLWRGDAVRPLTPKAFAVLRYLVTHAGTLVTRDALLEAVWDSQYVSDAALASCIRDIRQALGEQAQAPQWLETVRGRGFRFLSAASPAPALAVVPSAVQAPGRAPVMMVGRDTELTRLHQWFGMALHGDRQMIFVTGEPGIGKTTLVDAFVAASTAGAEEVWSTRGQCVEHYGLGEPYLPVLEALGRLAQEQGTANIVAVLAQYAPTWLMQLPALLSLPEREGLQRTLEGATPARMMREFAEALETLSARSPLVMVLEDLHWCDPSTVELLAYVAQRRGLARLLVLGTYRPADVQSSAHPLHRATQELQGRGHCQELHLGFLPSSAVEAYVRSRVTTSNSAPLHRLATAIHQRSEGNPLFMVTLLEHLQQAGVLAAVVEHGSLPSDHTALALRVPETLRQLIAKQCAGLRPEAQQLLAVASVAGQEFTVVAVAAALEQPVDLVETWCAGLVSAQHVLYATDVEEWPDGTLTGRYRFRHDLYRETLYTAVPASQQIRWHRQIGMRLEAGYGQQTRDIATELAVHFMRGRDIPRAVRYLHAAGEQARQRGAPQEALLHLSQGLELLTTLPETAARLQQELDLQLALGPVWIAMRGYAASEVEQTYQRARTLCSQLGDTPQLIPALRGLCQFYHTRGALRTARELEEQLVRLAQRAATPALLREAHDALGISLFFLGEYGAARSHLEQGIAGLHGTTARAVPPSHSEASQVRCLARAALPLWCLGYPAQAMQRSQEAVALARALADPQTLAVTQHFAAYLFHLCQDVSAVQQQADSLLTLATAHGFPLWIGYATFWRGWALARQGQTAEGLLQMQQGMRAVTATGQMLSQSLCLLLLAEATGSAGQIVESLRLLDEAHNAFEASGRGDMLTELYRLRGELLLQQNSAAVALAEANFQQALDMARQQQARAWELRAVVSLARLWQHQGKTTAARHLLEDVFGRFTEGLQTTDLQEAAHLLTTLESHRMQAPATPASVRAAVLVVGRDTELTRLQGAFTMAMQGERQFVLITGEPGIGKTALVDTFVAALPSSPQPLWLSRGQCVEHYGMGEAYMPVLEALGHLGRRPDAAALVAILAQYAPTWLAQLPALVSIPERDSLQRTLQGATQARMMREFADALETLTSHSPVVLVLEDLHWCDPSTVELLAYVAQRRGGARLLVLGTYRPAEAQSSAHPLHKAVQELQARGHCQELRLGFLPDSAVATYVCQRLRADTNPATQQLATTLYERTEGNPLFMVTMLEHLLQESVVTEVAGQWQLARPLTSWPEGIPENLRQLIDKQFTNLRLEEQHFLEVASVAGQEFAIAAVAAALEHAVDTVETWGATLAMQQQFLRATGVEAWPDGTLSGRYRFVHALHHQTVYDRLAAAPRLQLHRRIATRKEQAYGPQVHDIAAELAQHFTTGHDFRKAVHYYQLAGETALRRHAHQEAILHLRQGLALLNAWPDTSTQAQHELPLQLMLGAALMATRSYAAAETEHTYRRALALCQQVGDTTQHFSALRGIWQFHLLRGELEPACRLGEELLQLAQAAGIPALLLEAHRALASTYYWRGEFIAAHDHFTQGAHLYDRQQHQAYALSYGLDPGVACLGHLALTLWMLGYPEQAMQRSQAAYALAQQLVHPVSLMFASTFHAMLQQYDRAASATYEWAATGVSFAEEQGFGQWLWMNTFLGGWARTEQGDVEAGLAQMRRGMNGWQAVGAGLHQPYFLALLAEAHGKMGQGDTGLRLLQDALLALRTHGESLNHAELYRLTGELTLQQTPHALTEAEAYFHQALAMARQQRTKALELRAAMSLGRLWQQQGRRQEARHLLEEIYNWFREGWHTADLRDAAALLSTLGSAAMDTSRVSLPATTIEESLTLASALLGTAAVASLPSEPQAAPFLPPTHTTSPAAQFRHEGDYWTLVFQGTTCRVKNTYGLHYIDQLLRAPQQDLHVLTLVSGSRNHEAVETSALVGRQDSALQYSNLQAFTDPGAVLDASARAAYAQRLQELRAELEEAQAWNDPGRRATLQAEMDFLVQELKQAIGLGGRSRKTASVVERARVNVTRAIKTAITRITELHPALGQYLAHTIHTGTFCVYTPDTQKPIDWQW